MFGPLSVDVARREVLVADEQISLTRTQFDILATLAQRAGAVTTRQELLDAVGGRIGQDAQLSSKCTSVNSAEGWVTTQADRCWC